MRSSMLAPCGYVLAAFYRTTPDGVSAIVPTATSVHEINTEERARLTAGIEAATEALLAAELSVTAKIKEGDAQRLLLETAETVKADCIFVGSRSLSGRLERLRLGSVSAGVAPRAPCSVEVVRERSAR